MLFHLWLSLFGWAGLRVSCSSIPDSASVVAVGAYSDMRYTEEHAYGHVVELWRASRCLFGLLEVSEGLAGDTLTSKLLRGTLIRSDQLSP